MYRILSAIGWALTLSCLFNPAPAASAQATSTPEERAQWVQTTRKLETAPLDDSLSKQGDTALKRVEDVHDVHVPCARPFLVSSTR